MHRRVLLVEDEQPLCQVIARNLSARGHEVVIAGTAEVALSELAAREFDLMLLDIDLPDRSGWEVVRELRTEGRSVPFVVVSAVRVSPEQIAEFQPLAYLPKPFPLDALLRLAAGEGTEPGADAVSGDEGDIPIVHTTLADYDRRIEASRRRETVPELLAEEFEERFAELAVHVIAPAMNAIEAELVDHGHRAELIEEQHQQGPPAWARGAQITLAVLPRNWNLAGERYSHRPRLTFVGDAAHGQVEVHSWISRPDGRAEGRRRSTFTLDELTSEAVEMQLREFVDEVFAERHPDA
ncbi:MAG: response regulator [Dehalococcoidia bacterium]